MSTSILRTTDAWWVATPAGAARIATKAKTTAELLADQAAIAAAGTSPDTVPVDSLALVSPVTAPCRVVAQATNFASHVKDVGMNPDHILLTFFRKASGSIAGPYDDVIRPAHVRLLDYEVEIGLVIGREMPVGTTITADNWADYVAALVVTNDISARDVQLSKIQFFEAKSYPSFTPVGPALVVVDGDELKRFDDLRLQLSVNGELRQNMPVRGDMLYPPGRGPPGAEPLPAARARRPRPHRHPDRHRFHHRREAGGIEGPARRPGKQRQLSARRRRHRGHRGHRRRGHRPRPAAQHGEGRPMSAATTALAGTVAVFFTVLGTAKIRAVPAMRQRAAHVGMSTSAYRRIGALEVAGAAGVLVGLAEPRIGGLAGAGLLALLGGALIAHRRTGDGLREAAPALISAAAVAAYLAALWRDTR